MSDTSLVFTVLGKDKASVVFGKVATNFDKSMMAISNVTGTVGKALEDFAKSQQDSNAALGRTSIAIGETEGALRNSIDSIVNHTLSAHDAADAYELLAQKGVDTKDDLAGLTTQFDAISDATGIGLTQAIEDVEGLLGPLGEGIHDVGANTDQFTRLVTQTDVPLGSLQRNLARVPDELQSLGLGLDDVAAGVDVFKDRGFEGKEAVREFRRAVEASEGDMGAFTDALGIGADEWEEYQKAAEPVPGLTDDIAKVNTDTMTPMEKLSQNVENLMFKYGGLSDAASAISGPLLATSQITSGLVTSYTKLSAGLKSAKVGLVAKAATVKALTAVQWLWNIALNANPIGLIVLAVVALIAIGILLWKNWDTVVAALGAAWEWIWDKLKAFGSWFMDVFWENGIKKALNFIGKAWDWVVGVVKKAFQGWVNLGKKGLSFVKSIPGKIKNGFVKLFTILTTPHRKAASWIIGKVKTVVTNFKRLPGKIGSAFGRLFSIITSPFKRAFNAVAGLWNRSIGSLSFSVPSWVPGLGGKGFSFPRLPFLAQGGTFRTAGAAIVGEAGPELVEFPSGARVSPLDKQGGKTVIELRSGGTKFDDALLEIVRRAIRVRGGNVQVVLAGRSR